MTTISQTRTPVPADPVLNWRLQQLEAGGYPPIAAAALAERMDVDLHLAVRLLRQGCSIQIALQILL